MADNEWVDESTSRLSFQRDRLENFTGYMTLIGFSVMLVLYCIKEATGKKFASPDIVIFLFGFFTSEIKSISIGRGDAGSKGSSNGMATKIRSDILAAMLALILTFHYL